MEVLEQLQLDSRLITVAVLLIGALVFVARRNRGGSSRSRGGGSAGNPQMTPAMFEAEAAKAFRAGELEEALDLYMRAQNTSKAAQVAQRLGRFDVAAEMYEHEGDLQRAAALYRKAGVAHKAQQLEKQLATVPEAEDEPSTSGAVMGPQQRAEATEQQFRQRLAKSGVDEETQKLAEKASNAWLDLGDIRRAADICRDAGLVEQAVNYYVNVLGEPAEAAGLVSAQGDHARAAELYELAGMKERALGAWVKWGTAAPNPMDRLKDVQPLGEEAMGTFLERSLEQRPVNAQTLDLHYRAAVQMQELQINSAALRVMERIMQVAPQHSDVSQRVQTLRQHAPAGVPAQAPANDAGATQLEVPDNASKDGLLQSSVDARPEKQLTKDLALDDRDELQRLVNEAAAAAVGQALSNANPQLNVENFNVNTGGGTELGQGPVNLNITAQQVVTGGPVAPSVAHYEGPSVNELQSMLAEGDEPSLSNIEVYYRLGVAQMAEGNLAGAKENLSSVEEVSPGYRDAANRIEELDQLARSGHSVFRTSDASSHSVGRYTLKKELGRGGMAVVYAAHDTALERDVAMKFMAEEASSNPMFMDFFKREARAAAALNHPNIVTIYDVGTLQNRAFICMEMVKGSSVEELLENHVFTPAACLRAAAQILAGLEYAHQRRIIHRDIKPANIMRTDDGLIKVMDFGLAKSVDGPAKTTAIAGTPAYMPPEQLKGKGVDHRTDLFAVGATLYEMLTGEMAFDGFDRNQAPRPITSFRRDVPPALEAVFFKAMAFDQQERYQSAGEMLNDLRRVARDAGMDAALVTAVQDHAGAAPPTADARATAATAVDSAGRARKV